MDPEESRKDSSSSEESSNEDEHEIQKEKEEEEEDQEPEVQIVVSKANEFEVQEPEPKTIPAKFIVVDRKLEIQTARLLLPIVGEECKIMEKVSESDCIILCGSTGCGKTTQMPQFLYEGGYTRNGYKIGITEPRRVAAMAMSERVAQELSLTSREVSYHIRFEKNTTSRTQIKFMTDGVLLQEIKNNFELSDYSVIIVDEAHERTLFTDVLLGLLSMIVRLRRQSFDKGEIIKGKLLPPLKLIIMSATLSVDEFAFNRRLFPPQVEIKKSTVPDGEHSDEEEAPESRAYPGSPSVLSVDSRQYPVTCHFAKFTNPDYLKAAFQKICRIHREEAPGTILAFVTGQQEAITLCKWLKEAFPKSSRAPEIKREDATEPKENKTLNLDK
ncbi:ATP-dependent RNA helicase dhx37 [Cichlidogyrus casuarinus]|uniref:RNA helicase n=1 Tax=Cichlidogyrus casuarinus TaxID=1844966 RepID=A0ABD2QM14_9PLAT